jgi:phospholipase C
MPTMTSIKDKIEIVRTPQDKGWEMTLKIVKYDVDGAYYVNGRPAHTALGTAANVLMSMVAFEQHIEKYQAYLGESESETTS